MERAHSRTRDEHTVTDSESHDHTDPLKHSDTQRAHNRFDPRPTDARGPDHAQEAVTHDPVPIRGDGPRGGRPRFKRGRPQRTQPCPLPLPHRALSNRAPPHVSSTHVCSKAVHGDSCPASGRSVSPLAGPGIGFYHGERIRYHHSPLAGIGFFLCLGFLAPTFAYRTDIFVDPVTCAHVTLTVWDR